MNDPTSPDLALVTARVTELEILLTHLQQTVDQLHEVVLRQTGETARLTERLSGLQAQYSTLTAPAAERDPLGERPPHY
jgi:uncharacterized coiled-coil protein SlyX